MRAFIHGFAANVTRLRLSFGALDDNLTKEVIDHINKGGFSNLECLSLNAGHLTPTRKADLEQALLNIRSSKLRSLWYDAGSFEFARAMAETKDRNPELTRIFIDAKIPEGFNIVVDEMDLGSEITTLTNGVSIKSYYKITRG